MGAVVDPVDVLAGEVLEIVAVLDGLVRGGIDAIDAADGFIEGWRRSARAVSGRAAGLGVNWMDWGSFL